METINEIHEMLEELEKFFVLNFGTNKIDNNRIMESINNLGLNESELLEVDFKNRINSAR